MAASETLDVAIIDNGGANVASLRYALERLGAPARLTRSPSGLDVASHVILPGVGAARDAMTRLESLGLVGPIRALRQPLLGICLGMQLLFESSEEGDTPCLGLIEGRVRRLREAPGRPVPHMGWNSLDVCVPSPLLAGLDAGAWCYFVHSYAAPAGPHTLATTDYGAPIPAVVQSGNFYGAQFHPERSAACGARLLANFLGLRSGSCA